MKWEDPSDLKANQRDWRALLEPLLQAPERWARIVEIDLNTRQAQSLRQMCSRLKNARRFGYAIPDGRFEFVTRTVPIEGNDQKVVALYARYMGPNEQ